MKVMSDENERLLSGAVSLRNGDLRTEKLPTEFSSVDEAKRSLISVLLHEARESLEKPLESLPQNLIFCPVDVDTELPGLIVSQSGNKKEVLSKPVEELEKMKFDDLDVSSTHVLLPNVPTSKQADAERDAEKRLQKELKKSEKRAERDDKKERNEAEKKKKRKEETPEEREERLVEQRKKREERKEKKGESTAFKKKRATDVDDEEDFSISSILACKQRKQCPKKKRGRIFSNVLPIYRLVVAFKGCNPLPEMENALCKGEASSALSCVVGPPGCGKTRFISEWVQKEEGRVLVVAPTNVGVVNVYNHILKMGLGDETSLVLSPHRIPPGTCVLSNDPKRRIVCSTLSYRFGKCLRNENFDTVLLDEAGQVPEAISWCLFRKEVKKVLLVGDFMQLKGFVSISGKDKFHDRSLLERLVKELSYENTTFLDVQNRMCPQILEISNSLFYSGRIRSGEFAPKWGSVRVVNCEEGREEESCSSFRNRTEADKVSEIIKGMNDVVVICPYVAQCNLLLSYKLNKPVHTIDSFQGKEAENVVLSLVRDGTKGVGFWKDERRLVVALTRARTNLVIVFSNSLRGSWDEVREFKDVMIHHSTRT
jgi:GTPase SAR1 family protein